MRIRLALGMICLCGICLVGLGIPAIQGATPQGIAPRSYSPPPCIEPAGPDGPNVVIAQIGPNGGPGPTPTIRVIPDPQPVPESQLGPAPAVQPPKTRFVCPKTRYIDCMPPIGEAKRPLCTKEYIEWAKAHCPDVQVVY